MNKELENLDLLVIWATNGYTACDMKEAKELAKPIETALKEYEQLKVDYDELDRIHDELVKHKNKELDDVVRKLKALEIIKNKRLDVSFFINRIEKKPEFYSTAESMNKSFIKITTEPLTQEEYELLKEVVHGN